jgi:short subunit dehydrogenase-like uncharacterized protein
LERLCILRDFAPERSATMTGKVLIYGASGYTGKLIARVAIERGLRPILAGRNLERIRAVAEPLGLAWQGVDLADRVQLDATLKKVAVVLCDAGPFSATSRPMADACIRNHVHYLDITGEIDVFEALAARDLEAKEASVMLLPAVGFDVVPSDCLAAHMKRQLPDATTLQIYLEVNANTSRGTAKTMIEGIAGGTRVRRGGRLIALDRPGVGSCDFGHGAKPTVQISWGDVSTAFYSTGIPNIEVQFVATPPLKALVRLPGFVKSFLGFRAMQAILKACVDRLPDGPSNEARRSAKSVLVGVARNEKGESVRSRLRTPEGYTLTAMTAVDIAKRVASGDFKTGFRTPSLAYGSDYILGFDGVTREELNA